MLCSCYSIDGMHGSLDLIILWEDLCALLVADEC
jgi:hypothetical protein